MTTLRSAAIAAGAVAGLSLAAPTAATEARASHGDHGTPAGWKFTWPGGEALCGRTVFVELECYSWHEVRGERFPVPVQAGKAGPELSMMGPLHYNDSVTVQEVIDLVAYLRGLRRPTSAPAGARNFHPHR